MRIHALTFALLLLFSVESHAQKKPASDTVILDAAGVKNLRIETAVVEEAVFEETAFALGRIEARPEKIAAVSSRIAGRVVSLTAFPGDQIAQGAEVAKVESRQPGNPPPQIPLTAPIEGLVTRIDVRLGDPVEPEKALLEVTDLSEVYAVARVPDHLSGRLQPGAIARISLPAAGGEKIEGRLLRFGTSADAQAGTIDAIFLLKNPGNRLRPGMRAEFSLVIVQRTGVLAIPRSALQGEASKRFVFVKHFDLPNAFVKAPVVVGETNDRQVEIVSGLFPADEVVTEGAYSLAFAGGGSVSLKEALDAAHGHAHNEDGSEITSDKKSQARAGNHDHSHEHDEVRAFSGSPFWMIVSGVLFVLLVVVSVSKRRSAGLRASPGEK